MNRPCDSNEEARKAKADASNASNAREPVAGVKVTHKIIRKRHQQAMHAAYRHTIQKL